MKKTFLLSLLIIIIDQAVKIIVINNMKLFESITIIPGFFNITYVQNTGAAFSILNNNLIFLILISLLAIYLIYKYLMKKYELITIFLLGGIIANLIDRIYRGYVIDYLAFKFLDYSFPIFNIADIVIVISCIILGLKFIEE